MIQKIITGGMALAIAGQTYLALQMNDRHAKTTAYLMDSIGNQTATIEDLLERNQVLEMQLASSVVREVTVTGYTPTKKECDDDPTIAASMNLVRPGTVAVSRDLFDRGWVFGRKIYIAGHGIYKINDLMNSRHKNRIDVFFGKEKEAKKFGVKLAKAALLKG